MVFRDLGITSYWHAYLQVKWCKNVSLHRILLSAYGEVSPDQWIEMLLFFFLTFLGLYELWKTGRYKSYPPSTLIDLVARILALVPPWTRVYRVQRYIPGVQQGMALKETWEK
jgi:hypothetical protein